VLEVFSGQGNLWQACAALSLSARGFDNRQAWEEDVTVFDGFMLLLLLVMSVKDGGADLVRAPLQLVGFFVPAQPPEKGSQPVGRQS
jgi:hypothetical protein